MRETCNTQPSIFDCYAKHEIGNELAMMSDILDNCSGPIDWVEADLIQAGTQRTGRTGLPVESVLRCAVLKQVRQLSYKELAFYLEDSGSFRSFARLPQGVVPGKSALQENVSRIKPETWERINQALPPESEIYAKLDHTGGQSRGEERQMPVKSIDLMKKFEKRPFIDGHLVHLPVHPSSLFEPHQSGLL